MPATLLALPPLLHSVVYSAINTAVLAGAYTIPASLYPTLLVTLSGQIVLHHGSAPTLPAITACGGTHRPRQAWAAPGTRIVLFNIRHGQWPRLFGDGAAALMDRWVSLYDLLPAQDHGRLDVCHGQLLWQPQQALNGLMALLTTLAARHRHLAADMVLPEFLWCADHAALCRHYHLSERQLARRFQAAYGQSLRHHRRQLRSSRAIRYLLHSTGPHETLADIALQHGFYDQAHFQRDIRHFCGQTAHTLRHIAHHNDNALWALQLAAIYGSRLLAAQGF